MRKRAVIFDVDGTLIDTNSSHVQAWANALEANRYHVSKDRIEVEIGKGGDKLVPSILGKAVDKSDGEKLRKGHTEEFKKIASKIKLPLFSGVVELLSELKRRDVRTAIATSSSVEELEATQHSAGIDLTQLVDVVATGADASDSKPAPGILNAAIKKLKMSPAQCAMIGDTPFDVDASRDGGVICFGLTCGGVNSEATLRRSGARAVYFDPANVLYRIDEVLQRAFPGTAEMDRSMLESLMREALKKAEQGMERGEVPIGCVLAGGDGTIIAGGYNELNGSQNRTAHAEMVTFAKSAGKVPPDTKDLILVSTLEPCVMCLGAAMEAAVDTVLYGMEAPADGGRQRVRPPVSPESQMPRILGGILADEVRTLFKQFLKKPSINPQQEKFVKQLLETTKA